MSLRGNGAFWISVNVYKFGLKQAGSDEKRSSGERSAQFSKRTKNTHKMLNNKKKVTFKTYIRLGIIYSKMYTYIRILALLVCNNMSNSIQE